MDKRSLLILAMLAAAISSARADVEIPLGHRVEDRSSAEIFDAKSGYASSITRHAVVLASRNWEASGEADTLVGGDGVVMYAYGATRPIITCEPLHISVIKLLVGEKITNLSIGDSIRWKVQPTTAGNIPVVVVKPTEVGIATNLVVTTDQGRVYYFTLRSERKGSYVPEIAFYDPQQLVQVVHQDEQQQARVEQIKKDATVATFAGVDPSSLDFEYSMQGDGSLKPVRVFSAQGHTYIQMPSNMKFEDAPAIFVVTNHEQQLANYRLIGSYYVIDGIPNEIKLVLGAGSSSKVVTVKHEQHSRHSFFGG